MLTVQVRRWSQAAASLPPQQAVMGRVHSCYARIINVRTPGGRLLTLQGEGMLQAPWGSCSPLMLRRWGHACPARSWSRIFRLPGGPQQRSVCVVPTPSSGTGRCRRNLD